jgi:hypothetical protein
MIAFQRVRCVYCDRPVPWTGEQCGHCVAELERPREGMPDPWFPPVFGCALVCLVGTLSYLVWCAFI